MLCDIINTHMMMKDSLVILRIVFTLGLLGVMVFFSGTLVILGVVLGMLLFQNYFEGIVALVLLDGLYSFSGSVPHVGTYTIIGLVVFVIVQYLKQHLSWYEK